MRTLKYISLILVCIFFLTGITSAENRSVTIQKKTDNSQKRVALVIGNASYKDSPLKNPVNDARKMTDTLSQLGFDVVTKKNSTQKEMEKAINEFTLRLSNGDIGVFFFAGHGAEVGGRNYIIPIGAEIADENDVKYKTVDVQMVLEKMESSMNNINIVVLDACRNNPFTRGFRSATRGLASMDAGKGTARGGTIIAYATASGSVASDGAAKNGVFTEEFTKNLLTPDLKIDDVFKRTAKGVRDKTAGAQKPFLSTSVVDDIYLTGDHSHVPAVESPMPTPQPPTVVEQQPVTAPPVTATSNTHDTVDSKPSHKLSRREIREQRKQEKLAIREERRHGKQKIPEQLTQEEQDIREQRNNEKQEWRKEHRGTNAVTGSKY